MTRTLTKAVIKYLAVDTHRRAEFVVEEIGDCLDTPQGTPSDLQVVYSILKWWYLHASGQ